MTNQLDIDIATAHKYYSAECFNRAWDYIEKPLRTSQENDQMLSLSLASLWHWQQRDDCTATNLSIAYWQVSRVFALLRQPDNARHYGNLCLDASLGKGVLPFYQGYAYEALARAENVAGNFDEMERYLIQAHQIAAVLADKEEKKQLLCDLASIR